MALFRNIGPVTTIVPGATHYWEFWFGRGQDVGPAVASPNLQLGQIKAELVVRDPGLVEYDQGEGAPAIHYTLRVHDSGTAAMDYNLNIGTFQ